MHNHTRLVASILDVLEESNAPLTSRQVTDHPSLRASGADIRSVSTALARLSTKPRSLVARKAYDGPPLSGKGNTPKWVYYYQGPRKQEVNAVYSAPEPAAIELLGGAAAKAVSLTVAGVTIRIELAA